MQFDTCRIHVGGVAEVQDVSILARIEVPLRAVVDQLSGQVTDASHLHNAFPGLFRSSGALLLKSVILNSTLLTSAALASAPLA